MWGPDCEHEWGEDVPGDNRGGSGTPTDKNNRGEGYGRDVARGAFCRRCNAWRGTLGLEPTPELYVEHLVSVMREVKRTLRDDGTLWLNLGDSYASSSTYNTTNTLHTEHGWKQDADRRPNVRAASGLKPKDLVGIPWMVAFALRADGWWLRQENIWYKKNPMPESCDDRTTRAHESVFHLTKSERYAYDQEAVREPHSPDGRKQTTAPLGDASHENYRGGDGHERWPNAGRNKRSVWEIATQPFGLEMCRSCKAVYDSARYRRLRAGSAPRCTYEVAEDEQCGGTQWQPGEAGASCLACDTWYTAKQLTRLPRAARCACGLDDAWVSHFATFPEKLVEPCILAGCPEGGTVLDPFAGSGTVGLVAERLGRHSVLIDAKDEYCEMARHRTAQMGLMTDTGRQ